MRNPETTRGAPPASDLSTEDLTRPRQGAREETEPRVYPGEAGPVTGTAPASEAPPPEAASAPEAEAEPAPMSEAAPEAEAEPAPMSEASGVPVGEPLVPSGDAGDYRDRWQQIQGTFVDDPREAVRNADTLVAEVIQSLATTFADHKRDLEAQWSRGEEIQTEELRVALQHYRAFFNQLLDA
ncbi:hypothetical protein [Streptomyces sp. NPDC059828]|uniref:hypothetical protein n=1 Tax=Streptomyces sp. NPDC059828 TaxID=3346965 RepID=UPI003658E340